MVKIEEKKKKKKIRTKILKALIDDSQVAERTKKNIKSDKKLKGLKPKAENEKHEDENKEKKRKQDDKVEEKKRSKQNVVEREAAPDSETKTAISKEDKVDCKGRKHTVSVAVPASIIANAQSFELRAYLVGQIARATTIFTIDEIVIYEDQSALPKSEEGVSQALAFFVRNLQYLETPQYLRRNLFQIHKDLKFAGLQNPLDAPHHMRMDEWSPYREGTVTSEDKDGGCWVNCGLQHDVWIDQVVPKNVRITVKINRESWDAGETVTGKPVSPEEPRVGNGMYWGYQTRVAASLKDALEGTSFDEGYDLIMGTSERGDVVDANFSLPKFKHALIVFGGLGGLEEVLEDDLCGVSERDPSKLFKTYVNACVNQGSRTIRCEEALLVTMSVLRPVLMRN